MLLTVAALGVGLLLFLIIKIRLQPFVALLIVSIAVGLGSGLSVTQLFGTVQKSNTVPLLEAGMGGTLGHVAVIIGLGTMLGSVLEASGGAQALAGRLLTLFGERRAPLAMGVTGVLFGIPVFFDVGIFVLAPVVYATARRGGGSILRYALPMLAGLSMTHAFLPPHPGPVAAAGLLHVDLGWVALMGTLTGIPAVLAAWAYAAWIARRVSVGVPSEELETPPAPEQPVPLPVLLTVIGTPLVLILLSTFSSVTLPPGRTRTLLEFVGHPFVALTIALFLAYWLLGVRRGWSRASLEALSTASLKPVGNILLVVGAGGIFGAVLKAGGVAQAVADLCDTAGLPVVVLAWLLSAALRVAQGSATVAIVTTAGIVAPVLEAAHPTQAHAALVIVAISAGSVFASHVNDGGFWMVAKYFGIPERETLVSWTVLESVLSVAGFGVAGVVSLVV
ncbi:GntP family permease [Streptomyces sp. ET3-23]|uniref:GntP family permease n=1 Tax=Streptomyces sp. ET3-23 TaxID=2885643 RepID=UPI0035B2EE83